MSSDFQVVPGSTTTSAPSPFLSGHLQATGAAPYFGDASLYGGILQKPFDGKGGAGVAPGIVPPSALDGKQLVPQLLVPPGMMSPPQGTARLTAAQAAELEMARRRAQKAAEGKRANATAMRRAKRRAGQLALRAETAAERPAERSSREDDDDDQGECEDDLEAKLANTKDEKEAKRLKRLLRNRVSAQQARERKKSYVSNLENTNKDQAQRIAQLEQQVQKLQNETTMLRQILKNVRVGDNS